MPAVMYCTWNGSDSIVVLGFCLLYVGWVHVSDRGRLALEIAAWRVVPLAVTGGNGELGI